MFPDTSYIITFNYVADDSRDFNKSIQLQIDGLVQERRNSIANALDLRLSYTEPSKFKSPSGHAFCLKVISNGVNLYIWVWHFSGFGAQLSLSGVPDFFDRNKILNGYDLSRYQVPHCIRVFFYFVWFVFIHHNFQFYFKLCTYCNILDINLS